MAGVLDHKDEDVVLFIAGDGPNPRTEKRGGVWKNSRPEPRDYVSILAIVEKCSCLPLTVY